MPIRPSHAACLLALLHAVTAMGQVSYQGSKYIGVFQRALPGSGPGAAPLNPAHLSEARLVHLHSAAFTSTAGKSDQSFFQAAATLPPSLLPVAPIAFSAGFGGHWNGSRIDNSSALYREATYIPGFALSWPASRDRAAFLALGLSFPIQVFNAFGVVGSNSAATDLGLLGVLNPGGVRLATGLTWHNMDSPEVRLPDGRGAYEIPGWIELAFDWTSPGRMFQWHWEFFLEEPADKIEGPSNRDMAGINGWSFEFRPVPLVGFKFERPRDGTLTSLGVALHPAFAWGEFLVELNASHDNLGAPPPEWLFGEDRDEGRGLLLSFSAGAGF